MRFTSTLAVRLAARHLSAPARLSIGAGGLFFLILLLAGGGAVLTTQGQASCTPAAQPVGDVKGVPKKYIAAYTGAAERFKLGARGPAILAAVHKVETNFGTSDLPGVKSGTNSAGAMGPMQFLAGTWAGYEVDGDGDGDRDVYDNVDAIYGAANYLHASGAPEDWYGAIFAYNHADWYVADVENFAEDFGDFGDIEVVDTSGCEDDQSASGPAELDKAIRLTSPQAFKDIPADLIAPGFAQEQVDERIWADAVWVMKTYDLRLSAGREPGHATHSDGTAMDLVPAGDNSSQVEWDRTAGVAAKDLGWIPSCGAFGTAPVCPLKPAIQFIGYDGFPSHGSPRTCRGGCPMHIHISWRSSSFGAAWPAPPPAWVLVFPAPGGES